jgi:polar amino acid transport system substrate-binding protein
MIWQFPRFTKTTVLQASLLCLSLLPLSTFAQINIKIVSEEFPPLQYQGKDSAAGYVHDFMLETIRRVKQTQPVVISSYEFLPWKRALLQAEQTPNTLLFALSRTPTRENKYIWLGEVSNYQQSLHRLKSNSMTAQSIQQAKQQGLSISIQNGSAVSDYFIKQGLQYGVDFYYSMNYQQGIQQLFNGRIDLIALSEFTARQAACQEGFDGNQLVAQIPIEALAKPLWAVFNKDTPTELVDAFRREMANIRKEGLFDRYYKKHMLRWNNLPCIK